MQNIIHKKGENFYMDKTKHVDRKSNPTLETLKELAYYVLPISLMILIILSAFNQAIWADEVFTLSLIKHSWTEMFSIAATDVHPPLYYIFVKIAIDLFGSICNPIYLSKLVSTIPIVILLIIGFTYIRKRYGIFVSFLFNMCMVGMPRMRLYATEIRMYSFGILFVFCTYLFAMKILDREETRQDYIFLSIFSACAAYTHYFACASAIVIYVLILLTTCIRKEYKRMRNIFFSGISVVVLYLPWLFIFLKQLMTVKSDYWIDPIDSNAVFRAIFYLFQYNSQMEHFTLMILVLSIFVLGIIGSIRLCKKKNLSAVFGILVWIGTLILGVGLSLAIRPIFVERYLMPSVACLWFGTILGISSICNKQDWKCVIIGLMICICIPCTLFSYQDEQAQAKVIDHTFEAITPYIQENTIFLTNDPKSQREVAYFYPGHEVSLAFHDIEGLALNSLVQNNSIFTKTEDCQSLKDADANILVLDCNGKLYKKLKKYNYDMDHITTGTIADSKLNQFEIYNIK